MGFSPHFVENTTFVSNVVVVAYVTFTVTPSVLREFVGSYNFSYKASKIADID